MRRPFDFRVLALGLVLATGAVGVRPAAAEQAGGSSSAQAGAAAKIDRHIKVQGIIIHQFEDGTLEVRESKYDGGVEDHLVKLMDGAKLTLHKGWDANAADKTTVRYQGLDQLKSDAGWFVSGPTSTLQGKVIEYEMEAGGKGRTALIDEAIFYAACTQPRCESAACKRKCKATSCACPH